LSTHFLFVIALLAVIHSTTGAEQSQAAIFEHPAGLNRAWLLAGNQLTVCVDVIIALFAHQYHLQVMLGCVSILKTPFPVLGAACEA